jgi:hypothetical protein
MTSLETRETAFSNNEFAALARNDDGDIIDLSLSFIFIPSDLLPLLTNDDASRVYALQEELEHLMAELRSLYL